VSFELSELTEEQLDEVRALIVTGWRDATDEDRTFIEEKLRACRGSFVKALFDGGARGVDSIARAWGKRTGLLPRTHKANWAFFGPSAGPVRNFKMVQAAVAEFSANQLLGVAFPHKSSIGTFDCISKFEHFHIHYVKYELRAV
jgi:hypothetical protein